MSAQLDLRSIDRPLDAFDVLLLVSQVTAERAVAGPPTGDSAHSASRFSHRATIQRRAAEDA